MKLPWMLLLAAIVNLLCACATFAPKPVGSVQPTPDSSTPTGLNEFNSGYLGWTTGKDGKVYESMTLDWHAKNPKCPGVLSKSTQGYAFFAVREEDLSIYYRDSLTTP